MDSREEGPYPRLSTVVGVLMGFLGSPPSMNPLAAETVEGSGKALRAQGPCVLVSRAMNYTLSP